MKITTKRNKPAANHTHSFMDYKIVPKEQYRTTYKNVFDTKPQQHNFVYRSLKNQKIIHTILGRIFRKPKRPKTQLEMQSSNLYKQRCKTSMSEWQDSQTPNRNKHIQNIQTIKRVCSFNGNLQQFQRSLDKNKKRMSLLNKFNEYNKNFQSKLPQDLAEQTRQSIQQNCNLIKICIEQSVAKNKNKQFKKRYSQIMQFSEPLISSQLKKTFMKISRSKRKGQLNKLKSVQLQNKN